MAENWYPIIDGNKCVGCMQCYEFCQHGVYAVGDDEKPKVIKPENCVEFCKGCGKICDQKAISYFGDK